MRIVALLHAVILPISEPPPRLYGPALVEVEEASYSAAYAVAVDAVACSARLFNALLASRLARGAGLREKLRTQSVPSKLLMTVTFLLCLDCGASAPRVWCLDTCGLRPFRLLRPLVHVLLSPQLRRMVRACLKTASPLVQTFVVLVAAQRIYATLGLNLFSERRAPRQPLRGRVLHRRRREAGPSVPRLRSRVRHHVHAGGGRRQPPRRHLAILHVRLQVSCGGRDRTSVGMPTSGSGVLIARVHVQGGGKGVGEEGGSDAVWV